MIVRRVGACLATGAVVLIAVGEYGLFSAGPEDGVNIGAALLSLLGSLLAVAATVLLLVAFALSGRRTPVGLAGAVTGVAMVGLWLYSQTVLFRAIDPTPYQLASLACFVVSVVLLLAATRRSTVRA